MRIHFLDILFSFRIWSWSNHLFNLLIWINHGILLAISHIWWIISHIWWIISHKWWIKIHIIIWIKLSHLIHSLLIHLHLILLSILRLLKSFHLILVINVHHLSVWIVHLSNELLLPWLNHSIGLLIRIKVWHLLIILNFLFLFTLHCIDNLK